MLVAASDGFSKPHLKKNFDTDFRKIVDLYYINKSNIRVHLVNMNQNFKTFLLNFGVKPDR